jgi:hypothetical protein
MVRAALLAIAVVLASVSVAAAQGLPDGTFASTKEGCAKLKENSPAELGDDIGFTVMNKSGFKAGLQHCDFVTVTARNATSWLATAFCEEPGYAYPDLFAILEKNDGDLSVTRMTVQQPSYDQTEEEPSLSLDDLDPAEIGREEGAGSDESQAPEEEPTPEAEAAGDSPNTYFRCDNVKP